MTPQNLTEGLPLFGLRLKARRPIIEAKRRDSAIERVEDRNDPGPNEKALAEMQSRLRHESPGAKVTSDTLLPDLSRFGFTDNRAVGALMRRATAAGWIQPTDQHRQSTRPGNHCVPRRVYLNTYHEKGGKP